jgi:hypothetical protein
MASMIQRTIMPTMVGAGGAILTDVAMGMLPLPATLKTGMMRPLVKSAAAMGMGMLARGFVGRSTANKIMAGAFTVVAYDWMKTFIQRSMPQLTLGDAGSYPEIGYADPYGLDAVIPVDDDSGEGEWMGDLVDEGSIDDLGSLIETDDTMGAMLETEDVEYY